MNKSIFDKAFNDYQKAFGHKFPLMEYMSADDDELCEMMLDCVEQNKPASVLYPVNYDNIM